MKTFVSIVATAALLAEVQSLETLVTVYSGPTECAEDQKMRVDKWVQIRYHGTIDESSPTGEKGKALEHFSS